jgi:hypothetical protein
MILRKSGTSSREEKDKTTCKKTHEWDSETKTPTGLPYYRQPR